MFMAKEPEEQQQQWLTTREALEYLQALHPERAISQDTFYHWVMRGKLPCRRLKMGNVTRFVFLPEWLQQMSVTRQGRLASPSSPYEAPIPVHSDQELDALRQKYGPLVDEEGLLQELYRRTGHWYTPGALKQRRLRGTLRVVGYSGGRKKQRWYPLHQLDSLRFYPEQAERQKRYRAQKRET